MKNLLFLLFGGTLLMFVCTQKYNNAKDASSLTNLGSSMVPRAAFLGQVGNKSYYYDNSRYMNWTQAASYCSSYDLQLATIETVEEYLFLSNAYSEPGFDFTYWISAQDSHERSQLRWIKKNGTRTKITVEIDVYITDGVKPSLTCGAFRPHLPTIALGELEMYPCSNDFMSVLCESV